MIVHAPLNNRVQRYVSKPRLRKPLLYPAELRDHAFNLRAFFEKIESRTVRSSGRSLRDLLDRRDQAVGRVLPAIGAKLAPQVLHLGEIDLLGLILVMEIAHEPGQDHP